MSNSVEKLVDDLSKLTVLQAADLVKQLEEAWGVSAAAPAMMMQASAGAAPAAAAAQTEFNVILAGGGDNKINVIKEIRKILPTLGLPEAKALVESAPKTIKESVSKDEAEKIKTMLEAAGAQVKIE